MGQLAADGSDMTKKPRRGMGPSVVKAAAGATFSTATSTGDRPTELLESGGMETGTSKVSHGTSAEELLSAPARRTARPSPQDELQCELAGVKSAARQTTDWSPDSVRSVGCQRRGSREVAKGEAVTEGAAKEGAAVTFSVGSATRGLLEKITDSGVEPSSRGSSGRSLAMECSREGELGSDMPTRPRGGMAPSAGEAADGSDMTKKPRRGMGPSAGKAAAGATSSTTTAPGRHPGQLPEEGGMETRTSKVSHGHTAEELLSTPA